MHIQPTSVTKKYRVRDGFYMRRGESLHRGGEVVKMTEAEACEYRHMIEAAEDAAPPAAPSIATDQRRKR